MEIKKKPEEIWQEYLDGLGFNTRIGLEETVKINNDFYNDRQWEGVLAPDLDKPCFNIIKPAVNYYVSQLVSDDVGASVEVESGAAAEQINRLPGTTAGSVLDSGEYLGRVMREAVAEVLEQTDANYKHRLLLKRMALDGDMVLHSYFDREKDSGQQVQGQIATEIINNTDIFFGNPATGEVEEQPYIIIRQRKLLDEVCAEAARWQNRGAAGEIWADNESGAADEDESKKYVTVLSKYFKQGGTVHFIRVTDKTVVRPEVDLGYRRYPVAYASWEREKSNYHGISPVTGKINNQIMLNKMYALASLDRMNYSFPKVIYDECRLPDGWDASPGVALACQGDPGNMLMDFRPKDMSGQIMQLISDIAERTNVSLGIYDAALGNAKPDNTSALLAVQQAAAVPLDLQRRDFYRFVEDCVRIWLDMMSVNYGVRRVVISQRLENGEMVSIPTDFDFADIGKYRWRLKVDIGASVRWSEVLQVQMLDNLMRADIIPDAETYLECLPDGYLKNKGKLLEKVREAKREQRQIQQIQQTQNEQPDSSGITGLLAGEGGSIADI